MIYRIKYVNFKMTEAFNSVDFFGMVQKVPNWVTEGDQEPAHI